MPRASQVGGFDLIRLLPLMLTIIVALLALLLGRRAPPTEPEDPDGGGGSGPRRPIASEPPRGGLPLADAPQARMRLRGHERRADRGPARVRRPTREPDRTPAPHRD